jgi:hypothetical protein
MKSSRRMNEPNAQIVREPSDEDVFEHVISGVRLNRVSQLIRENRALAQGLRGELFVDACFEGTSVVVVRYRFIPTI